MGSSQDSLFALTQQLLNMKINALTYNIHKLYNFSNTKYLLDDIKPLLASLDLDFVFLQEVTGLHPKKHESDYQLDPLEHLADDLWDYAAYGKNAVYPKGHHGNAILSKFPIESWQNYDLSQHALEQRGLLLAKVALPNNQPLTLACTHIDLTQWTRNRQVKKIIEILKTEVSDREPIVFGGDFNDWNGRVSKQMVNSGFTALPAQKTFPARFPVLSLDKVFTQNMQELSCHTLDSAEWRRLSDHLPIQFQLKTKTD